MQPPRVSVVLSVYNGAAYLEASLRSVLGQTFTDFELIAVDDGSTDATPVILARAAGQDSRVSVLTNPDNQGLTRSLNRGLRAARGDLIARQDADDLSAPERLAHQVAYLDADPGVGLLGTAYTEIDATGRRLATRYPPATDTGIRAQMLYHNALCHSSVMVRRAALDHAPEGYDETLAYSQDVALWLRLLGHCRAANLPFPLVSLRKHPENVSTRFSHAQQRAATTIAQAAIRELAPGLALSDDQVALLRAWYGGLDPRAPADQLGLCHVYFDLLEALAARPDAEVTALDEQRRHHLRAVLGRATTGQALGLARAGVLTRMLRADPVAFAQVGGARLLRRLRTALPGRGGLA